MWALRQQPSHHTPTARAHTTMPPSNTTTTTTPTIRHRQPPHTIAHEHLQPSTTADREDHADQWGTNPTVGSTSRFEDGNHTKMHNASNADAHGKLHTFAIAAAGNHMDSRCARQPPNRLDHGERSYGNQCCTDDTSECDEVDGKPQTTATAHTHTRSRCHSQTTTSRTHCTRRRRPTTNRPRAAASTKPKVPHEQRRRGRRRAQRQ